MISRDTLDPPSVRAFAQFFAFLLIPSFRILRFKRVRPHHRGFWSLQLWLSAFPMPFDRAFAQFVAFLLIPTYQILR